MSEKSYYSESFLSEDSVVTNSALVEQLRSEMKAESNRVNEEVRRLKVSLSEALIDNADYKKRIADFENTVDTQGLKIDELEKTIEEKMLETEMQKLNVRNEMKVSKPAQMPAYKFCFCIVFALGFWLIFKPLVLYENYGLHGKQLEILQEYGCLGHSTEDDESEYHAQKPVSFQENYGLHENQLESLQKYGCLGHFTEDDESETHGGKKYFDKTSFALMMKAYKNGLKEFTLKVGALDKDFSVGKSKLSYSNEKIELPGGDLKWRHLLSILHEGRKIRFKTRIQVMDAVAGYERKIYDWKETDSEGVYEQIILGTDWPERGGEWYPRYHLTFLE